MLYFHRSQGGEAKFYFSLVTGWTSNDLLPSVTGWRSNVLLPSSSRNNKAFKFNSDLSKCFTYGCKFCGIKMILDNQLSLKTSLKLHIGRSKWDTSGAQPSYKLKIS